MEREPYNRELDVALTEAEEKARRVFRKVGRPLTAGEIELHDNIKDRAASLYEAIEWIEPSSTTDAQAAVRAKAIAKTKLEEAVMWATKGLTA